MTPDLVSSSASPLVLDASMTLAWVLERVDAAESRLAADCLRQVCVIPSLVPELWHLEVINVLCLYERRRMLPPQAANEFLCLLDSLPVETDGALPSMRREAVRQLARRHGLSGYDATYLDLALRQGATLATFDRQLADACRAAGGRVFGDDDHLVHEPTAAYGALSDFL